MKESEYIIVSNKVRISAVIDLMRGLHTGEEYGVSDKDYLVAMKALEAMMLSIYQRSDPLVDDDAV